MDIRHLVSETYVASGNGQTTFAVPAGTQTIKQISVAGRKLAPGIDYTVRGRPLEPEAFTLKAPPNPGDNIHVTGIIWKARR